MLSKLLGVIGLGFALSACGGPSCIRNTDCPHGHRCLASNCQGPGTGGGGGGGGGSAAVSGSAAGASGGAGTGGESGAAGATDVTDAGTP